MTGVAWRLAYTVSTPDCRAHSPMGYDAHVEAAAPVLAGLGYDGVEAQVRDASAVEADELRRVLGDSGLALAAVATGPTASEDGLTLGDVEQPERRDEAIGRVRSAVDLAASFGALVTIGRIRGNVPPDHTEGRTAVAEALGAIDAHAARAGVRVVLEPQSRLVGPFLTTVAETAAFLDRGGWEHIGLVLDTFHMSLEERSCAAGLLAAGERLWHVQLGDTGRSPLGLGSLDVGLLADVLDGVGYRGWLTMEHAQGGDSADAARRSARAAAVMRDRVAP